MRNIVSSYVGKFKKEHRKRWRAAWVLLALALIVSAAVTWQLHSTGIAQTNVTYCGLEEHTHTEDCYEKVLVCGLEEESGGHTHVESCYDADGNLICGLEESEGHTHTDECYELQLVCGLEEHIHTVACLSDATADVETASDWEETLPELTEDAAENVVLVAESQIGYTESTANFTLADDGETRKGYTRYGAWYGEGFEYVDWDAMFAAFCLHYAGVSEEDFPVNSGAYAWMADLKTADLYADAADYTPKAGDLVFFDTDGDGKADTVGIVASAEGSESDEIATNGDATAITVSGDATEIAAAKIVSLSVIVGDYSEDSSVDAVCKLGYASDDESILGYGILPEDIEVILATENEDTEEQVLEDQTLSVIVEEYTVTLSGLLPSGASFAAELVDLELEDEEVQFALEITIYDADGNEFEPEDDAITVTVESDSITEDCAIYYVPEEGDLEEVGSEAEDGTVSFDAEHFSVYAGITSTAEGESAYDTYMATISEYEEEAYALADGDDEEAVALTSDLGDLLDAAYEDFEEGNLTEEEYAEIETAVNELWDWLEENFDLYGTSIASYYDENGELVYRFLIN